MLKQNVGKVDRLVRFALAAGLFSLFYFVDGPFAWLGLAGLIPLVTGLVGTCPLYQLFGVSTCPVRAKEA